MSPENLGTYTIELVAKRSKLSLSTECDIASTSSNILIREILKKWNTEISNNSSNEVHIISVDDRILKAYDVINFVIDLRD